MIKSSGYKILRRIAVFCLGIVCFLSFQVASAETTKIAVATNFKPTIEKLIKSFENETAYKVQLVSGSTGKLYSQIQHGAPFDVFLSADQKHVNLLVKQGQIDKKRQVTYAIGRLVLWAPKFASDEISLELLGSRHLLAIANPKLAPYGKAAVEVLSQFKSKPKIVMGENVGQAFGMVATGNADLGFVARSYFSDSPTKNALLISSELHSPILQDAGLLKRALHNPAAVSFFEYLQSSDAKQIIAESGYDLPENMN